MRITLKTYKGQAIKMGRNSTEWTTDIDVTTLTKEQRDVLVEKLATGNNGRELDLCDATGEITAASIQAYIDAKAEKARLEKIENDRRLAEAIAKVTAAVEIYEAGGVRASDGWYDVPIDHPVRARLDAEDRRRIDAWEASIAPEVAAYLAGGPREFPSWHGSWAGKKETFDLIAAEDKRRYEQEKIDADQRKLAQLTEVVTRLGTDVQKEKWAAGLMARDETLDLLWHEMFPGAMHANVHHLEKIEGYKRQESEKETLTDEQFVKASAIIKSIPDSTAEYYHQYYADADDNMDTCDVVRISKTVGEYTLEADYII